MTLTTAAARLRQAAQEAMDAMVSDIDAGENLTDRDCLYTLGGVGALEEAADALERWAHEPRRPQSLPDSLTPGERRRLREVLRRHGVEVPR